MILAFPGGQASKDAILAQLAAHRAADEIIKGEYWENGKGCAVGCTLHSCNHMEYETRFGIPITLARLEDCLFEGMPNGHAVLWPELFMNAFVPGRDYSRVGLQFLHWLLTDTTINPGIDHELVKAAVKQCAVIVGSMANGDEVSKNAVWSAARNARSAVWSADSAVWSAGWSAVWSADSAGWSAAAAAGNAAESAMRAAENAAYLTMANKLIELIEAVCDCVAICAGTDNAL